MCTLIGIDWAKEIHYACIMNENGAQISLFSFLLQFERRFVFWFRAAQWRGK